MVPKDLEPHHVWEIFENVFLNTYRASNHEEFIRSKIHSWVDDHADRSISYFEDETGNIYLQFPATSGYEDVPPLLLQGHMDMVCETDRTGGFDFENSPIPAYIQPDGIWIAADHTTLGADDGIGVSLILGLLLEDYSSFIHGPLEILITVSEETGLEGAFGVEFSHFDFQSRYLLNIDSEDIGIITIGSAGGGETYLERALQYDEMDPTQNLKYFSFKIKGLLGGHSGTDIHLPRASANQLIARTMSALLNEMPIYFGTWNGGSKSNAIARESEIKFAIEADNETRFRELIQQEQSAIEQYYCGEDRTAKFEPNLQILLSEVDPIPLLNVNDSRQILASTALIPHGYLRKSPDIPDLVETSNNFSIIWTEGNMLRILGMPRSSVDGELRMVRNLYHRISELGSWTINEKPAYPGWKPEPESPFLGFIKQKYEEIMQSPVKIEAIHAGLECGIIGGKVPGIQMVSIGPTVENAHTPMERLRISDVGLLYGLLLKVLSDFARNPSL